MSSIQKIHLVRHAESAHNVSKDFSLPDPFLTPLGITQATALGQTFPHSSNISIIISSPLRRAIQTTLHAFSGVLDKRYYTSLEGGGGGVENGLELLVDANLQERSNLPCDTGSEREVLEGLFPGIDFKTVPEGWLVKEDGGVYSQEDAKVRARARGVREELLKRKKEDGGKGDVVIVTHGVFMKFLSGDKEINLPKAGWKSYVVEEGKGDEGAVLVAVE